MALPQAALPARLTGAGLAVIEKIRNCPRISAASALLVEDATVTLPSAPSSDPGSASIHRRSFPLLLPARDEQVPGQIPVGGCSCLEAERYGKEITSNNLLLTRFSGTVGMKTGFLCASGRNYVGLATRNGKRVMVVIFGRNHRTRAQ